MSTDDMSEKEVADGCLETGSSNPKDSSLVQDDHESQISVKTEPNRLQNEMTSIELLKKLETIRAIKYVLFKIDAIIVLNNLFFQI